MTWGCIRRILNRFSCDLSPQHTSYTPSKKFPFSINSLLLTQKGNKFLLQIGVAVESTAIVTQELFSLFK